jgi:formyl-CoA transferase
MSPGLLVSTFRAADGNYVTISAGTFRIQEKLAACVGARPEDFASPELAERHRADLDHRVREWIAQRPAEQAAATLVDAGVVASRVYSAADIAVDRTYRERHDVIRVTDEALGSVAMPAVIPHLRRHPGRVWRTGPALGADNDLVFHEYLGMDEEETAELLRQGII